jgi:hypothetical protein
MPDIIAALEETGRSGSEIVALAFLEVIREAFFARVFAFFGTTLCGWFFARSPALPPPAPVEKLSGSFFAASLTVETTQSPAEKISNIWMKTDTTNPVPRLDRNVLRLRTFVRLDDVVASGGGGGVSSLI